jgi:hypothetical protein
MGLADGNVAACTGAPIAARGEACSFRARAFVKNNPPRAKSAIAMTDINKRSLEFIGDACLSGLLPYSYLVVGVVARSERFLKIFSEYPASLDYGDFS